MRNHALVARKQLRTSYYTDDQRARLGKAVEQARIAAGFKFRTDFCKAHGIKNLRGLQLLELGDKGVGQAFLFEVADALPNWTRETPRIILEGGPIPPTAEDDGIDEEAAGWGDPSAPPPDPADFGDEMEYLVAVYEHLRSTFRMSHESAMSGFHTAASIAIYSRKIAERSRPDTEG